jgi:hypothetical protein
MDMALLSFSSSAIQGHQLGGYERRSTKSMSLKQFLWVSASQGDLAGLHFKGSEQNASRNRWTRAFAVAMDTQVENSISTGHYF